MHGWNSLFDQRGAIVILVAVVLIALLSFVALVIDIGYGLVTNNELQNAADAAALAGARQLGRIYEGLTATAQQNYVLTSSDRTAIVAKMQNASQSNMAGGQSITINDSDVRIGQWNLQASSLTVTNTTPDAVEITTRRDASANSPIPTFFARIMGVNSLDVSAKATAALTSASQILSGELSIPIGISKYWFGAQTGGFCGHAIRFNPTGDLTGCAGWNTFLESPPSDSEERTILKGLKDGTYQAPQAIAGQTQFNFTGGNLSDQTFNAFNNLYNANQSNDGTWKTFIVVYDRNDCSNPQTTLTIVGFATAIVSSVDVKAKQINANVVCKTVETARGGCIGCDYGTKGSIPGLVQ